MLLCCWCAELVPLRFAAVWQVVNTLYMALFYLFYVTWSAPYMARPSRMLLFSSLSFRPFRKNEHCKITDFDRVKKYAAAAAAWHPTNVLHARAWMF